jgi:hypothetical protein
MTPQSAFTVVGMILLVLSIYALLTRRRYPRRPASVELPASVGVPAKIWPVAPDGTVADIGFLGHDVAFRAAEAAPGYTSITIGRLTAPRTVLTPFFRRYGDLLQIAGNRLRVQVDDESPRDYERAVIVSAGVSPGSGDRLVSEQVRILARERPA